MDAEHPEVHVVMQHGPGKPLRGPRTTTCCHTADCSTVPHADAVVLQGGAGGVMDMRAIGRVPIVVPRVPVDDEVVDDHQLIFTERAESSAPCIGRRRGSSSGAISTGCSTAESRRMPDAAARPPESLRRSRCSDAASAHRSGREAASGGAFDPGDPVEPGSGKSHPRWVAQSAAVVVLRWWEVRVIKSALGDAFRVGAAPRCK